MNISKRRLYYILVALSLLCAGGVLWFDYAILLGAIDTTAHSVIATRSQVETIKKQAVFLSSMQKDLKQALAQKKDIALQDDFSSGLQFISFMESVAQTSGNTLAFTVDGAKKPVFKVQISGSFDGLLLFLKRMAQSPATIELYGINKDISLNKTVVKTDLTITPMLATSL